MNSIIIADSSYTYFIQQRNKQYFSGMLEETRYNTSLAHVSQKCITARWYNYKPFSSQLKKKVKINY